MQVTHQGPPRPQPPAAVPRRTTNSPARPSHRASCTCGPPKSDKQAPETAGHGCSAPPSCQTCITRRQSGKKQAVGAQFHNRSIGGQARQAAPARLPASTGFGCGCHRPARSPAEPASQRSREGLGKPLVHHGPKESGDALLPGAGVGVGEVCHHEPARVQRTQRKHTAGGEAGEEAHIGV